MRYHAEQQRLWHSPHRFNSIVAGRRSGKTELEKRKLVLCTLQGTDFPDPRFFAAAPVRDQAKRIFWEDLKKMIPRSFVLKQSESELFIRLLNGSELWVVGLDRPERIEGSPWDGGVITEYANIKPKTWGEHIRPAVSDRGGWIDIEGVPEGRNHFYFQDRDARAEQAAHGLGAAWGAFHWVSADILSPEEIDDARGNMDEQTFRQEYEATFLNFEGRAYYAYNDILHAKRLPYFSNDPLILCFDFNVSPGVAVIAQEMKLPSGVQGTGAIGEVWIETNSNTPAVCRRIVKDWRDHAGVIRVYGDSTGGGRHSSQTEGNDWDLVTNELSKGFGKDRISFHYPAGNPSERSRVNAVNSRLRATSGTVRFMVDPVTCPHLITDLEGVQLLQGGSGEIDKKADSKLTHISDAIGYYIVERFPVVEDSSEQAGSLAFAA